MRFYILLLAISLFYACSQQTTNEAANTTTKETSVEENPNVHGIEVSESAAISLADLSEKMTGIEKMEDITVKAIVTDVCQKKGCWMNLERPDGSKMKVTFKDYALFMPTDIVGKEVVIHGYAANETMPIDQLKHYAEDAGKTQEEIDAITEPELALAFEADGVLIK
ncbi:DUF4920 domain-containing protein [Flexithrix dorotheae]|uniref:DUF4920 domain-containing protein n=1 Tax=Flexithrix dorotheae TaxID=70993 RepID=UPI0003684CCC|nr:DUF4920 domain-containing protein [Flexithrix dorotheae]